MRIIFTILFLFVCTNVHAGYYVFHTNGEITGKNICGRACRLRPDSLSVDEQTYNSANKSTHKVVNDVVVLKTQSEIDADTQAKADAVALAKTQRELAIDSEISSIDINDISLPLQDAEIDALGVSQNAKDFLKRLVRYIVTQPSN